MAVGNPQVLSLATRGILPSASLAYSSKGMLVSISESIYIPPTPTPTPSRRKGGKPFYYPGLDEVKPNELPKLVTITVMAYGKIVRESVIVDPRIKVSADDIEVIELSDGQLRIMVKGITSRPV